MVFLIINIYFFWLWAISLKNIEINNRSWNSFTFYAHLKNTNDLELVCQRSAERTECSFFSFVCTSLEQKFVQSGEPWVVHVSGRTVSWSPGLW